MSAEERPPEPDQEQIQEERVAYRFERYQEAREKAMAAELRVLGEAVAHNTTRILDLREYMTLRFEHVDQRFDQVDQHFSELKSYVDQRFAQVDLTTRHEERNRVFCRLNQAIRCVLSILERQNRLSKRKTRFLASHVG